MADELRLTHLQVFYPGIRLPVHELSDKHDGDHLAALGYHLTNKTSKGVDSDANGVTRLVLLHRQRKPKSTALGET